MQKRLKRFPKNFIIKIPNEKDWLRVTGILLKSGLRWNGGEGVEYCKWENHNIETCFFVRQQNSLLTFGTIKETELEREIFTVKSFLRRMGIRKEGLIRDKKIRRIIITRGEK